MYQDRVPSELWSAEWVAGADARRLDIRTLVNLIDLAGVRILPLSLTPVADEPGPARSDLDIVSIGIGSPGKGPRALPEALSLLRSNGLDADVEFVGESMRGNATSLSISRMRPAWMSRCSSSARCPLMSTSDAWRVQRWLFSCAWQDDRRGVADSRRGDAAGRAVRSVRRGMTLAAAGRGRRHQVPTRCSPAALVGSVSIAAPGVNRRDEVVNTARGYAAAHSAERVARVLAISAHGLELNGNLAL